MILLAPVGVLGLLIGSFLNVVIHRVPRGLSVVSPPSACPGCGSGIAPRDNVPLLSWVLLRGACRHCRAPISVRYPLVEAITAVVFLVAALRFAPPVLSAVGVGPGIGAAIELVAFLYLAGLSVALAAIDLDLHRLPDRLVLPAYGVGLVLLGGVDVLRGAVAPFGIAAAGAGASVLLYLALAVAKPGGMGLGDVKLAGALGLFLGHLGLAQLLVGVASAFVLGGLFGAVLLATGRAARGSAIPFGPWMLAGAWVGILAGPPVAGAYLSLFGLA